MDHQVEPSLGDPAVWRDYYDITASKALRELEASDVWMDVLTAIADFGSAYRAAWGSALVIDPPRLVSKPFNSIRNKVYRANVVERAEAPTSAELVLASRRYPALHDRRVDDGRCGSTVRCDRCVARSAKQDGDGSIDQNFVAIMPRISALIGRFRSFCRRRRRRRRRRRGGDHCRWKSR